MPSNGSMPTPRKPVYPIPEQQEFVPLAPALSNYSFHSSDKIIIDNGSTTIRAGWSSSLKPSFVTDNIISKYKDRKSNRNILLGGTEAFADNLTTGHLKSPYEGDWITNFDTMESMLDLTFSKLGINNQKIAHPIVMTETLGNAQYSRSLMSELLFEGYNAPSVTYGVDSLYAFHGNNPSPHSSGLVVSSGANHSHVIPVLDGRPKLNSAKKLNWGGNQAGEYMLKLMQLKYPSFPGRLTSFQAATMYRQHCYHSQDYSAEIKSLADPTRLAAADRIVQFPFVPPAAPEEKSAEDLEKQAEKRKEAGKRLQAQAQQQRLEKLLRQEEELAVFSELKESRNSMRKADFEIRLRETGFASVEDLSAYCQKIEKSVKRARNKDLGIEETENKEPPSFPLVNVPDHTLNEQDLKEKRRQRLMKAGYDARIRMKAEKEQEKALQQELQRQDTELRQNDPQSWLTQQRARHAEILEKIKQRQKFKLELNDRKSFAAQNRMKNIANLASDAPQTKKRRKLGHEDDGFGMNDSDWAVYKQIGTGEDSEDEEDDETALKQVEASLLEFDPNFTLEDTAERLAIRKHQLFNAFIRGLAPDDPLDRFDPENLEHISQLHVNIEQIRVPEVIWQPQLAGFDQAGLAEIIENLLKTFSEQNRKKLISNVFLTGGNCQIRGFENRLENCLQPILPVGEPLKIVRQVDEFDCWRGMTQWSESSAFGAAAITQHEYYERGADGYKAHNCGNLA